MARASWWARTAAFLKGRPARGSKTEREDARGRRPRLVIDTNVLIAAVRAPESASRQLLDAVSAGRATLLVSPPVFQEYRRILPQAVRSDERERILRSWIGLAEPVPAGRGERIVPGDPDDDKFLALALAGEADAIVSNDDHLLSVSERADVRVVRPADALTLLPAQG